MSEALAIGLGVGIPAALIVGLFSYLSIPVQKKGPFENIIGNGDIEMVENKNANESEHILVGGGKSKKQGKKRKFKKSKKNKNK